MKRRLAMLALVPAVAAAQVAMHATDPWIREAPPGTPVYAGYVTLDNRGARAQVCQSAESAAFEGVEMHRTVIEQGISRMLANQTLEVPPGSHVKFEAGGMHMMFLRPLRPLKEGDRVPVTLRCSGGDLAIDFVVRREESGTGR